MKLKKEIALKFGAGMIYENDEMTCFYTGLQSYSIFRKLFDLLVPLAHFRGGKTIDIFFSVLMRLRLSLPFKDLVYRMGYSEIYVLTIGLI